MRRQLIACSLFFLVGCDPAPPPESEALPEIEGFEEGFFSDEAVLADAVELGEDFDVVPCAGAPTDRVIRGQVVAPHGKLAWAFPEWLVPSAHAIPVEGENTVAAASVSLVRVDSAFAVQEELVTTMTDALGRYCINVPATAVFGRELMVVAQKQNVSLRRFALEGLDGNLSLSTEAVVRLVIEKGGENATSARLINLMTLADTALDLLDPVILQDSDDIESGLQRVIKTLRDDPRVSEKINAL